MKELLGKQQKKKKYFSEYYFKNKQRIQLRNKLKYEEKRNSPEKSAIDTQKRTEATNKQRDTKSYGNQQLNGENPSRTRILHSNTNNTTT